MKKPKQDRRKRQKELEEKANKLRFPKLQSINLRWDSVGLLLLFIGIFTLFAVSTPRTIILEDDGLFVSAAWFAGVAHTPGYPLYTILGWISSHLLPFGEIPWRVHLVSSFMGAITCICIAWLVLRRTGNRTAAYLASAALAVSEHFWSQAIISDVYTTNTALLFLVLVMVQEAVAKRDTRFWFVAAFLYGLGLANHWPLLILGSPIFIYYAFASGKEFWGKLHYLILSVLIPAVLLYGWMVWRSHQDVPINFLGSIDSLSEMISFIKRDNFADADSSVSAGIMDKLYYVKYFITEALLQFSLVGSLIAFWGIVYAYRNGWRYSLYGEVVSVLSSSLLLIGLLGFDYEYFQIAVFRPYPLVTYCILSLWLGLGINALVQIANKWRKLSKPIIYVGFSLIILALGIWNGRINYRANDRFAEQYAQSLFDVVEQDAILLPFSDGYTIPTTYYHFVEGKRPDIRLLEPHGVFLNDRVVQSSWSKKQRSDAWREFARDTDKPFYHQSLVPTLAYQTGHTNVGFAFKTDDSVLPMGIKLETNDSAKAFFKKMLVLPPTRDMWTVYFRNQAITTYGEYIGYAIFMPEMENYIEDVLPLAENNYWSLIGMISPLLAQKGTKYIPIAEKYLKKAKRLADDKRLKSDIAYTFYLEGLIEKKKGNSRKARNLFRKSIKISSKKNNSPYKALKEL